jgi:hypothetical protein
LHEEKVTLRHLISGRFSKNDSVSLILGLGLSAGLSCPERPDVGWALYEDDIGALRHSREAAG